MDFVDCEDPNFSLSLVLNYTHKFPSNTFYPPGVICARGGFCGGFCPTSGESGSPLMTQEKDGFRKISTEGLLSFVKGCEGFFFGKYQKILEPGLSGFDINSTDTNVEVIQMLSDPFALGPTNPLAYTKLYCYLPWIAEQYDLEYEGTSSDDPSCLSGSGDKELNGTRVCRNVPSTAKEIINGIERECIFPYYMDERLINDTCFKLNEEDFLDPVPRCPIWPVTTKAVDGINKYNSSDTRLIIGGYCEGENGELDPEENGCSLDERVTPFSLCKNDCKGGITTVFNKTFFIQICLSCLPYCCKWSSSHLCWFCCWNINIASSSSRRLRPSWHW